MIKWYISDGTIAQIQAANGWPSNEIADAFGLMTGKGLVEMTNCKTTVELSALEVLLICQELAEDH
ncbi:MAG: hypothetical protein HN617_01375 [Planctomycetaceae bacterium]|nr:hypothetical protein [Planctomycetaceae bacterium]MBT4723334.1 hypothetical protein [Planctomycetaceae bacterium]MBT5126103.1 hypothetical protein [Planctomycetaceae bacterium]MBT5598641.1 hypothetical protein [Planctomycetaceae bacterium]MBT5883779.1 hypothetical protein [Planctomycetaceae bacterium]